MTKSHTSRRSRRIVTVVAVVAAGSLAPAGFAQTSGSLSTQVAQNWTTAPWVITGGPGTYPDAGGVATWNTVVNNVVGTVAPATTTVTLNSPINLSGITYNSPFSMTLAGTATNNLALAASGGTLNATLSIANTPSLFQLANNTTAPITGGGTAGLTKTGTGTATLGATVASTYTGGTHINGGILAISATNAINDGVFGALGAGNGLSFNGGALFNNITSGWTTNRDIFVDAGGATIYAGTLANINGVVSGSGTFRPQGFSAVVMTFSAINTLAGAVDTSGSSVSSVALSGNGSFANAASFDLAGTLALSNATTNVSNRLSDAGPITSRGVTLTVTGNATAATSEVAGALTLANGTTIVTLTPNAAQATTLTLASITRQNLSTMFVRGTALGNASAVGVAQLVPTLAPTLTGGSGAAGSTTISIVPWMTGNVSPTATLNSSFVTAGATGLRPLASTEYAATLGVNAADNVRLTAATAAPASTANALVFAPSVAATLSGGPVTLTSGAFLYAPTVAATGTVSAGLDFGSAEGIITNASSASILTLSGAITGSGGVTLNNVSGSMTVSGASTYTGQTRVNAGTITVNGNITNNGTASPFGAGTSAASAIVLNPGTATVRIWSGTAAATFDRDVIVNAGGPGLAGLGTAGDTLLTVNGNIALNRQLNFEGGGTLATATIVNGTISGAGLISDSFSAFTIFNGNNTFTGGLNIQTGNYLAGSDTAFGTGTIFFSGAGFIQSKDAVAHAFANSLVLAATPTFQGTGALSFSGAVNLNGSRTVGVTDTAAAGVAFTGVVSNGALTKTGTGKLALNSPTGNTYTGGTVLGSSAATLNVNNTSGSGTGSGTVSIGTGSTLSGNFIIAGITAVNGTLSPGNSAGTANFLVDLVDGAASTTLMELANAGSADKVNVGGLLTLDGTVNVVALGGYVAQPGDSFDLFDWGTINTVGFTTATDLNLSGAPTAPGASWDTSSFLTNGTIRVVPEPATLALIAGVGLTLVRRNRRN